MYLSKFVYFWLILSATIVIWDATYVLLRPHSLAGGKYFQYFSPYQLYIKFDTLYGDNNDTFVRIQAWLNYVEIALTYTAVILSLRACKNAKVKGAFLAIVVSAFTFWKTVIYVWYAEPFLTPAAKNFTAESIYLFYIPTAPWLLCSLGSILSISKRLAGELTSPAAEKVKSA